MKNRLNTYFFAKTVDKFIIFGYSKYEEIIKQQ